MFRTARRQFPGPRAVRVRATAPWRCVLYGTCRVESPDRISGLARIVIGPPSVVATDHGEWPGPCSRFKTTRVGKPSWRTSMTLSLRTLAIDTFVGMLTDL